VTDPLGDDLLALAAAHGVATSYDDWSGKHVPVARAAVVAALAALDVDASSDDAVRAALAEAQDAPWRSLLPPSVVVRGTGTVPVRSRGPVRLVVVREDGREVPVDADVPASEERSGRVLRVVPLPDLPLGWHTLRAESGDEQAEAVLVVAPERVELPPALAGQRAWGWMVQLYAVRSADSWGIGDYGDLRTLVERTAADGAGVVLLNPLHAETPVPPLNPSPYSPSSRRFRSPLYLRIADLPEYDEAPPALRAQVDALRPETDPERIQRDPAMTAKLAALELLWPRHRRSAVDAFRAERGAALEDFALFCALAEQHGSTWHQWPEELRRPDAAGVAAARAEHGERIAFWCWVQLLVDEQLAGVAASAAGMSVGVVHDLAVGVDAGGADAWALQDALALGTTVGAPPDSFNQQGQNWGLPPWRADRLREQGYGPYRSLVQGVLRHAGRHPPEPEQPHHVVDAQPAGATADQGTYVSYDADAMLGVLALEAVRAGVVVVGEDLGTVEARVRTALSSTGVLGSAVLWFERDEDTGEFLPPDRWRPDALASVTTHDLPTAAGFLAEEHVRVRDELDQLGVPVEEERARVREERAHLMAMLGASGLLERHGGDVVLAMHGALAASPCRIVLAAYGDAVGDVRQPNLPGTVDQYPNWRLPVADAEGRPLGLEELLAHDGVRRLTALLAEGVRAAPEAGR
jgi:4-alpha-glucanotransferase